MSTTSNPDSNPSDARPAKCASTSKAQPALNMPDPNTPQKQYISGYKLFFLLASLTLIMFLMLLDLSILGTAIPRITTQFHSLQDVGWYVGSYTLASATLQPLSGKLYTHFDNRMVYLSFVILFEIGSLICGTARSSSMFIAGRAIAGLGGSGLINGGMTILAGAVPLEKSAVYQGILFGFAQIGTLSGPLIGGALTEHASWRWCFYINLPIGFLASLTILAMHIPSLIPKPPFSFAHCRAILPELDLIGFALFVPPSIMFLLGLQLGSGNSMAWSSATIICLFVFAGVMALVFICWEARMGDKAMIPGSILGKRVVWTSCVFGTCLTCAMIVASNWLPTYFQAVKGDGPTMSGVHLLPSILSQIIFLIGSGAAVTRLGYYLPFALLSALITALGNGLISTFTLSTTTATWIGFQIITGAGRGLGIQMPLLALQSSLPPTLTPTSLALLIFSQNFGTSLAIVISNVIFTRTLSSTIPQYAPSISVAAVLQAGSGAGAVRELVRGAVEGGSGGDGGDVEGEVLKGVLRSYAEGLRNVFLFLVGVSVLAGIVGVGMGWVRIEGGKKEGKGGSEGGGIEKSGGEEEGK